MVSRMDFICSNGGVKHSQIPTLLLHYYIVANIEVLLCGGSFGFVSDQVSKHLQTVQAINVMKRWSLPTHLTRTDSNWLWHVKQFIYFLTKACKTILIVNFGCFFFFFFTDPFREIFIFNDAFACPIAFK